MSKTVRSASLLTLLLAAPFAHAHEDDPKLLHRVPPYVGPGFRSAPPQSLAPSQVFGSGGQIGGSGTVTSFPSSGVRLLSWMTLSEFGSPVSGNDCWGYTSPSGREYAIYGHFDGTAFVEISDPSNPQVVANHSGPGSLWRDIKVYQDHAYSVSEGGSGIIVYDMSLIDSGVVTPVNTITTGGITASHNVAINEASGFLYRCGGSGNGLRMYDLSNPASPTFVRSWSDRYVHDAQIHTMTSGPWAGREIAFCCSGFGNGSDQTGIDILDVTVKTAPPILLSRSFYSNPAYSHQAWLSDDEQLLYLNDELDEGNLGLPTTTRVIDVSDLTAPFQTSSFTNGNNSIDHNLYVKGNQVFEANYTSGLRVYDITNPFAAFETAFFDTWIESDATSFNSLWSVYPFFSSGVVIGSDMEKGLFLWWVGDPLVAFAYPAGLPSSIAPEGQALTVQVSEENPGDLVPSSLTLHYDTGLGTQSVALSSIGGDFYEALFPVLNCGTSVSYYFSGQSTNGLTWNDPPQAPTETYQAIAAVAVNLALEDQFEAPAGWTVGAAGDTATTGVWERVNPNGTDAQPEDDHTPNPANQCWVTGQGSPGGANGTNDVDGGETTLLSPIYDLSSMTAPRLTYWRWYSNVEGGTPQADVFVIDISNDGGQNWLNVEVVGPAGPQTSGGWIETSLLVSEILTPTSQVRLRFVADDSGGGSIVEAAIDDLQFFEHECQSCGTSNFCTPLANSTGAPALLSIQGSTSVAANDLSILSSPVPVDTSIFIYSLDPATETPIGNGNLCIGATQLGFFVRGPGLLADPLGFTQWDVDLTNPPVPEGQISAGSTWYFQHWYRDNVAGPGQVNWSDGIEIEFCP